MIATENWMDELYGDDRNGSLDRQAATMPVRALQDADEPLGQRTRRGAQRTPVLWTMRPPTTVNSDCVALRSSSGTVKQLRSSTARSPRLPTSIDPRSSSQMNHLFAAVASH